MDYQTWISNLMAGRVSDEDQAARERFRALQAAKPQPRAAAPLGVEATGPNTWAASRQGDDDDALTTFTLMAGPGIPGVIDAA